MRNTSIGVKKMVRAAVITAVYVVLCVVFAPISVGPMQVRVSEALTLLCIFGPEAIVGVTLGCFLSNALLSMPLDMVIGTAATLLAGIVTYKLRDVRWKGLAIPASVPPVVFNAVIVGVELTILYTPAPRQTVVYLFNMLTVGAGQLISCSVLGVLLVWVIEKQPALKKMFVEAKETNS